MQHSFEQKNIQGWNLETAVGSQKSAQALAPPGKIKKCLITTEVTTTFCIAPCIPISYTSVLRPTAVSRLKAVTAGFLKYLGLWVWCFDPFSASTSCWCQLSNPSCPPSKLLRSGLGRSTIPSGRNREHRRLTRATHL